MNKLNNIHYNASRNLDTHFNEQLKRDWYSADYFFEYEEDQILLHVTCELLERDNYHLSINGKDLLILLAEKKEISRPIYIHHFGKNIMRATKYERLRSINIPLQAKGFYVRDSHVDQNHHKLIVVLGKTPFIENNLKETIIN